MSLSGRAAIVAVGVTEQGELPGRSGDDVAVEAITAALAEAGLAKSDVDGLITCRSGILGRGGVDTGVGALLGIGPRYSATLEYGTCNFSLHLGAMAIAAGLAEVIVLAYGATQRSERVNFGLPMGMGTVSVDLPGASGFVHIAGPAGLAFQRHKFLHGTTDEQLGHVAVAQRQWAQLNPIAVFQKPLTIDEYLSKPYLVEPLRRDDLTMISDGGAALILTTAERAQEFPEQPVYVQGIGERTSLRGDRDPGNVMRPWLTGVADDVFADAGMTPADVDLLYVQDATSFWVLQMLELYGFCEVGEGGRFLADGHTYPGGDLPVNTNGGQLSESYMWGWLHLCEAVRQLRGQCGQRQVSKAEVALYCSSMAFSKGAASILSTHQP
jgi:acetyl-CoA acetyltransferase